MSIFTFASAATNEPQSTTQDPFASITKTISSGDVIPVPVFVSSGKAVNFSLSIVGTSTDSNATMTIYNSSSSNIWSGTALDSEMIWGNVTLTSGNNNFSVENTGADDLTFTLKVFNVPAIQAATPTYSWVGMADPAGLNSEIEINFPISGLYTFDFNVNSNERYEFLLGTDTIQRTITENGIMSLYVDAGVQTITIDQDSAGSLVNWQVDISYSGNTSDSLPYAKENNDIDTEILPINLSTAAQVNMVITASGTIGDQILVNIGGATPQVATITDANLSVYAGETTWATFNLPAGSSSIELTTPNDLMSYAFEIAVIPTTIIPMPV